MRKILFAALVATGMAFGVANPGLAHDIKNERPKGAKKRRFVSKTSPAANSGIAWFATPPHAAPRTATRTST